MVFQGISTVFLQQLFAYKLICGILSTLL